MKNRTSHLVIFGIILWLLTVTVYLYPLMPQTLASHWDEQGVVNGTLDKTIGLFLLPVLAIGFWILFSFIPRMDPKGENVQKFRGYYNGFMVLLIAFLAYLDFLMILWNLGLRFSMTGFVLSAVGIFFFYIGILLKHSKQNWFIGIRTPWTLSSTTVWQKTHRIGGLLFKIIGLLAFLVGIVQSPYSFMIFLFSLVLTALFLVIYSYVLYRGEHHA